MKKIALLLIVTLFGLGCEKDDICPEDSITTPRLIIEFFDIETIEELTILPRKEESLTDHNVIQTDRNTKWIPQIEAYFDTPEIEYVLVGVSHLAGDDSVLVMLEELGYVVSRY